MRNDKIYVVMYKDYQGQQHMHFCQTQKDVEMLERNYDVDRVDPTDASFVPYKGVLPEKYLMA